MIFEQDLFLDSSRAQLLLTGGSVGGRHNFEGLCSFAGQEPAQVFFQKKLKRSSIEAVKIIGQMINEKTKFEYAELVQDEFAALEVD